MLQILTLYSVIKSKDTTECCVEVFRDLEVTRSQLQELELRVSAQFVCTASIAVGASLFTFLFVLALSCSGCGPCIFRANKSTSQGSIIAPLPKAVNSNDNLVPQWERKTVSLERQISTCPP